MSKDPTVQTNIIRRRDLTLVTILSIITLSIYSLYLIYQWAKDLNTLEGQTKYSPGLMLAISIVTLGVGGAIVECIFAYELENKARVIGIPSTTPFFTVFVTGLNGVAWLLAFFSSYWIVGTLTGITATILIQRELNMFTVELPASVARV